MPHLKIVELKLKHKNFGSLLYFLLQMLKRTYQADPLERAR